MSSDEYYKKNKEEINAKRRLRYAEHNDEIKAKNNKYRESHRDEINAQKRDHYQRNKEDLCRKRREWYLDNKPKRKLAAKKYYQDNKDVIGEKVKNYRENHKTQYSEYSVQYRENNKEALSQSAITRHVKVAFGLSRDEYDMLMEQSGTHCPICDEPFDENNHKKVLDHCHDTNLVRGVICRPCNAAIGMLKDNPGVIRNALNWLTK